MPGYTFALGVCARGAIQLGAAAGAGSGTPPQPMTARFCSSRAGALTERTRSRCGRDVPPAWAAPVCTLSCADDTGCGTGAWCDGPWKSCAGGNKCQYMDQANGYVCLNAPVICKATGEYAFVTKVAGGVYTLDHAVTAGPALAVGNPTGTESPAVGCFVVRTGLRP